MAVESGDLPAVGLPGDVGRWVGPHRDSKQGRVHTALDQDLFATYLNLSTWVKLVITQISKDISVYKSLIYSLI